MAVQATPSRGNRRMAHDSFLPGIGNLTQELGCGSSVADMARLLFLSHLALLCHHTPDL